MATNCTKEQEMADPIKPSSWAKDIYDLPKTIKIFVIIYLIYIAGLIGFSYVAHLQKMKEIKAGKTAKCIKCTEVNILQVQTEVAELAARDAISRAEGIAVYLNQQVYEAEQRATQAEQRATEAERSLSDLRNFSYSAAALEPLEYCEPLSRRSPPARPHRDDPAYATETNSQGRASGWKGWDTMKGWTNSISRHGINRESLRTLYGPIRRRTQRSGN